MVPSDDFQAKIDALRAAQAQHDEQIQALIRLAELQQGNLDKLDDTVADLAQALVKERAERIERQKEMADRQKYLDDRVDRLVSAIGEFVRKQN
jgi:hypothetical protein